MPKRTVALPTADDQVEVHLKDQEGLTRKYKVRTMTRSAKREVSAAYDALVALGSDEGADGLDEDALEDAVLRRTCDVINILLTGREEWPAPGDVLYDGWVEDRVTEDQIMELLGSLREPAPDPTGTGD